MASPNKKHKKSVPCPVAYIEPNEDYVKFLISSGKYNYDEVLLESNPRYSPYLKKLVDISRSTETTWCLCGICDNKYSVQANENVCCLEKPCEEYRDRMGEKIETNLCVTENSSFQKLVDVEVIRVAIEAEVSEGGRKGLETAKKLKSDKMRTFRLFSYRNIALWIYGSTGFKNRMQIPNCVVSRIREKYRSDNFNGFLAK